MSLYRGNKWLDEASQGHGLLGHLWKVERQQRIDAQAARQLRAFRDSRPSPGPPIGSPAGSTSRGTARVRRRPEPGATSGQHPGCRCFAGLILVPAVRLAAKLAWTSLKLALILGACYVGFRLMVGLFSR